MAIVEIPNSPGGAVMPREAVPPVPLSPSLPQTIGAAFGQENTITNLYRRLYDESFPAVEGYNPFDDIRGTDYQSEDLLFAGSRSPQETAQIKARIDRRNEERRILDASGGMGWVAQVAAGMTDPLLAVPGAVAVRAVKGGYSVSRSALQTAMAGGAQAGVQEAILQDTQVGRSPGETALSVASGAILGGLIGGGAAALLSRAERASLERLLDADRLAMEAHATGQSVPAPAGAAASDARQLEMFGSIPGTDWTSTTRRTLNATPVEVRRTIADLAENPYRFRDNEEGIATTQGPALDRMARMEMNGLRVAVADELDRTFADYRFGQVDTSIPRLRARIEDFTGGGEGKMSFADFKREVSVALQSGDQHAVPQVAQAAQFIRQKLFSPWADRAEAAVEGFKKADQRDGEGYFPHVWNKELIRARRPEFTNRLVDLYRDDQTTKRGIQQRLEMSAAQLKSWERDLQRWEARLARLQANEDRIRVRMDERAQEIRRGEKRTDALEERVTNLAEEVTDLQEFIAAMRVEVKDPQMLARIENMERDLSALRREERPVTANDLARIEKDELDSILTGDNRVMVEMMTGRRRPAKAPSFISWLVANGGIKDTGGDVSALLGGKRVRPGLVNNSRGLSLDDVAQKIKEDAPGEFPDRDVTGGGLPSHNEILGWIDEALRGREPGWWIAAKSEDEKRLIDATRAAAIFSEIFDRAGIEFKSVRDVAKIFRDERSGGNVRLDDLDRIAAEMEQVGEGIPVSIRRAAAEDQLFVAREEVAQVRATIRRAMEARERTRTSMRVEGARQSEAEYGVRQNRGRLGVLQDRLDYSELRKEFITDAIEMATRLRDEVRAKIEEDIAKWDGTSTQEAKSALKAREKYAKETGREEDAPRLESADSAIDRAVKRILDSERELSVEELRARASQTVDRILGSPDGRMPYDIASGGPRIGFQREPMPRGSLAGRSLNVSNAWAREWIEDDIEQVVAMHLRTIVPDVLLAERFGDVEMTGSFRQIEDAYSRLIDATRSEKERNRLSKERDAVIRDVAAVRDRVRGVYGWSPDLANMARVANAAKSINNLTSMGVAALSSLPDMAGVVFRHGLGNAFRDGWSPFFRNLVNPSEEWSKFKTQMRAIGIGVETATNARQHALDDVADVYRPQSRIERTLQGAADKFFIANLLAPLTDAQKLIASHAAVSEILRASKAVATGKATKRQIGNLAESGIDQQMAGRIWQQFQTGGEVVDGVHLPNTADWRDKGAADALNGAVAREVDIAVVTPGQEKPLWMSKPVISLLAQFKSFTAAATERILVANLQRRDASALSGVMFALGLGMLSYKLNSFFGGQKTSDRPQDWVKEAISRGGLLGWFEEGNALASKATRGSADIYRLIGADKPLSRFASRSAADMLLGPTWGKIESLPKITGAASSGEWSAGDTTAVRRLIAGQNLFYLRGLLNQVEAGANSAMGVEPKPER